jgi:hypothetical protein
MCGSHVKRPGTVGVERAGGPNGNSPPNKATHLMTCTVFFGRFGHMVNLYLCCPQHHSCICGLYRKGTTQEAA